MNPEQTSVGIVTGAARGIGLGVARRLALDGMQVVIADIDQAGGREAADSIGANALAIPVDVSDEASVISLFDQARSLFGSLDVLINNAGLADPFRGPVEELTLAEWQQVLDTNLTGIFLCCKHAVPLLRPQRGCIVNLASTRALQSEPHTEAYAASKGGVVALTHALAISLGPEIRVNAISPGWIHAGDADANPTQSTLSAQDHAQHPVGRVGRVEDVAAMAAYLASPAAEFVTGQNFVIDGGMTRKMIYVD